MPAPNPTPMCFNRFTEFNPPQAEVLPRIRQFNESYTAFKQGLKAGEDLPLNEALWTLEAGVNYVFRNNKDSISTVNYDTVYVNAKISNIENNYFIPFDEVMAAYESLLASAETSLQEQPGSMHFLSDVKLQDLNSEEATMMMVTGIGIGLPRQCEVKDDDYWYAANSSGQCGPYADQNEGLDASDRLHELINARHCVELGCEGTVYYTSVTDTTLYAGQGPNGFIFWSGDAMDCLDPDDMEYWWSVAETNIETYCPNDKVFIDVVYEWDFLYAGSIYFHKAAPVRYGIINCSGSGSE